ncbi:MAG: CofH family radical SAM protein [Thermodesulfobacteriota bacterium]|nr:CofH family radical SAM protein [Thermodesulfobacteriota bacterium]
MTHANLDPILSGERISAKDGADLFSWDLLTLAKAADHRRALACPGNTVGFIVDRIINFTNICEACCAFCAFHARADRIPPYEMTATEIDQKIEELVACGGTQVMLQGGLHPDYRLNQYTAMIERVKTRFPGIWLHAFSPAEVVHIARKDSLSIPAVLAALKDAGLDSMPGASDLLVDRIRRTVCPNKVTVDQWRQVMHALAENNMKSSATMTYGMGETLEEKIEHLRVIREVADETGIIQAFIPWSFSPANTRMSNQLPATGTDYLTMVAVARIFLDNVPHLQAGWLTEGLHLAQLALAAGADDMGGVLTEEVVVKATGVDTATTRAELIRLIQDAGKTPVQRDSLYRPVHVFEDKARNTEAI